MRSPSPRTIGFIIVVLITLWLALAAGTLAVLAGEAAARPAVTMCQYPSIAVWTQGPYLNAGQGPWFSLPCPTHRRAHRVLVIRKNAGRVLLVEVP